MCFIYKFNCHFQVFEHMEAKSGKKCPIRVTGGVLAFLKKYNKHVPNTTKYMFVIKSGTEISSSVSE